MMIIDAKSYTHLEFAEYGKGRAEGSPFRGAEICVIFPCTLPNAVLLNCVLGVMSKLEVLRFIFGTLDTERQSFITREDFDNMCDVLMEHERNPHSMRRIRVLFDKHAKEGLSGNPELFFEGFFDLMKAYEPLPYPIYRFQEGLRRENLGSDYWADKMQSFVDTRKRLKVKRI